MNIALIYYSFSLYSEFVMKLIRTLWPLLFMSSACFISVEKLSQRISLIGEVKEMQKERTVKREQVIIIKHSQGPLISFQGP